MRGYYHPNARNPLSRSADRIERTRFSDWPLALKSILGFWFVYALTVAARALMGTDPLTTLLNKLIVIHRYRADGARLCRPRELRIRSEHSEKGDRRRPRLVRRFLGHGRQLHRNRRHDARAKGGLPLPVARRLRDHREGPHAHRRAARAGAAGADLAARRTARCQQAHPLRRRHGGRLAVLLRRLERLLPGHRRAGRSAKCQAKARSKPKAPHRPRRSGRSATRSIRTSCSTRSTRCRRWSWPAARTRPRA